MDNLLHQVYYGNSIKAYLIAFAVIVAGFLVLGFIKKLVFSGLRRWLKNVSSKTVTLLLEVMEQTILPLLYVTLIYTSLSTLHLSPVFRKYMNNIMMVVVVFFIIRIVILVIKKSVLAYLHRQEKEENEISQISGLLILVNIIAWCIGIMFLMGNLGYDISTIIAGLGIGGIAIALAAQAVLGDFFSYFVLFFDKPFEVGDFIAVDELLGTVEHIGLKTTRLRELVGDQLIFSNSDLAKSRIHNYSRMDERRITFEFGVIKETGLEQLKLIPEMVNDIIRTQPKTRLDRGHFASFGDFSFKFAFAYYVLDPDYTVYMNTQQAINFSILEALEKHNIKLAYPTQVLKAGEGRG
jgi:small-conductance mechanosensitive channel